jgi:hypothetical protein
MLRLRKDAEPKDTMSGMGQTEKYSKRADIFRSSADNR